MNTSLSRRFFAASLLWAGLALGCSHKSEVEAESTQPSGATPAAEAGQQPAADGESSADAKPTSYETVVVDGSTTFQTWEGWGSSLQDWDKEARAAYRSERWRKLWVDDMGMTVLRISLLPTPLSHRGKHEPTKFRFEEDPAKNVSMFDYSVDARAAIHGQVAKDMIDSGVPLTVLASVWTPPHGMKTGARITNNGNDSASGRLPMDEDSLEQYGRYMLAAVLAWEKQFGVKIDGLSIQNEPRFEQGYNSMKLTPPEYAKALAAVATEFEQHGKAMRFFGPEDVGYGPEGDHSRIDRQLEFLAAIMADPVASKALHAVAVHGYGGDGIDSMGQVAPNNWRYYWGSIEGYGKPSWQTETGGGPPHGMGPVFFANVLFEGMTYGQVSMWCQWFFSQSGALDNHTLVGGDLNTDNTKYAVAKQYFRFVRPGDKRLSVEPADNDKLRIVAWQDPKGEHLSLVMLNQRDTPAGVEFSLGEAGKGRLLRRYQTNRAANFLEQPALKTGDGTLRVDLPPLSLTTLSDVIR